MIRFGSDKNDNRDAMEDFNGNTGAFPSHNLVDLDGKLSRPICVARSPLMRLSISCLGNTSIKIFSSFLPLHALSCKSLSYVIVPSFQHSGTLSLSTALQVKGHQRWSFRSFQLHLTFYCHPNISDTFFYRQCHFILTQIFQIDLQGTK